MAKYSPVAGIAILEFLYASGGIKDYLLVLAHDMQDPARRYRYKQLISGIKEQFPNPTIILDNSLIELGESMDFGQVVRYGIDIGATHVILPDKLEDMVATRTASVNMLISYRERLAEANLEPIGVLQGRNLFELRAMADMYILEQGLKYLAIPRIVANTLGSRSSICHYLGAALPANPIKVHLLGCSNNILDDIKCCAFPGVTGIDSANPITLALTDPYCRQKPNVMDAPHLPRVPEYLALSPMPELHEQIWEYVAAAHRWFDA